MKVTVKRWIGACVIGCLVLAVMLLPPQGNDDPFFRWTPRWSTREQGLDTRVQSRRIHGLLLWQAYRHAHDVEIAQREFGAKAPSGAMSVWYDADVSSAARREVGRLLAADESARGSWQAKGGVGVLVFTDTTTAVDGVRLPWGYNSGLIASTKVLPPTRATGGRCVTVIRIGHLALLGGGSIPADRALLDGCAFYDAFGNPGPQVGAWEDTSKFAFARGLSFAPRDSTSIKLRRWGYDDYYYGDERFARCAANDLAACAAMIREPVISFYWRFWRDASVPAPASSVEWTERARGVNATMLDDMVRDIGPERFARVWQSPKSLDSAYFDATGESLAAWVHRRAVSIDGPYHIGPLPTLTSAILTLLAILVSLMASARYARRPAAT
jgi:hypothetical protein